MTTQPTRILIIEDEIAHAEAIGRSLESISNAEVCLLRTLQEFRDQAASWKPDIALMDLNLPDGRATEVLLDADDTRAFPIVVLTSYGSEAVAVESLKAGAWDYLVKSPEAFRALPKILERVLREWGLRTEGKRLHRELQASEASLRAITESSLDVIYTLDAQGNFLFISPAWERCLGHTVGEALGKPFAPFVHPEDLQLCVDCLERVLATGQSETSPAFRVRHADGSWRWFQANASRMTTPDGEFRFVGVAHDITDRKQREDEREAALLSLQTLASVDRIVRKAGVTGLRSVNEEILEALLSIFGCDRAWLIFPADPEAPAYTVPIERTRPEYPGGGASGQLIPMSDAVRDLIETVVASEHPVTYGPGQDHSMPPDIAEGFSVQSMVILPVVPQHGKPWLLGLHQCSHARAWSEPEKMLFAQIGTRVTAGLNALLFLQELEESQAQTEANRHLLRLMADNVPDLIWAKDVEGRYLFVNQAMSDTLLKARDTDEPVGKTDLFFAERERAANPERQDWHTFGEQCQGTDAPVLASMTGQRFDELGNVRGEFLFLDVFKAPFLDEQNRLLGTVGSARVVTREKQIEAELQRQTDVLRLSEAQNQALIAAIPDLIFTNRRDGEFLAVQASDPSLLLVPQETFLNHWPKDILPMPLAEQFLAAYEKALNTHMVQEIEYSMPLDSGEHDFEARVSPCTQDTVITIVRDVTERNRAALALQSSRDLLAKAFAVSPDAFAISSLEDGVYVEINEGFTKVTGYTKEEVVGRSSVADLNPLWADANDRKRLVAGLKEKGEVLDLEASFLAKDGTPFFGLMSARLFEINGAQHVLSITRDITERKLAENLLRESEERFRGLLESVDFVGVQGYDQNGVTRYWNRASERLYGYTSEEAVGRNLLDLIIPPEMRGEVEQAVQNMWETGKKIPSSELSLLRKDGSRVDVYSSHAVVHVPGRESELFCLDIDVTERKRLEAQLQQSQKMESLGTLAGGVAHDMNNVLGAILGLASANLAAQPAGSPTRQALETIIRATERGGKMVKGLLSFARQNPAESRELDMNALLLDEVSLLERTTLAKVRLQTDFALDLRAMRGDASALSNAIMNLCVNAVDAMPDQGTLTLHTRNVDNDWIEVVVEDSGIGMPADVLEKALDPFFTTKEVGKGTGLGLSTVYSTVKAHHGQLEIQSQPGQGTRVMLRFPAIELVPLIPEATAAPRGQISKSALSVLVVDDDELIQSSMLAILEVLGHSATGVDCGEDALAKLEAGFQPDVIILDMNMPGLGGAGTLPRLRLLRPTTPVLLATGRVDQFASDLAAAHPHVTLLSKPFSMKELQHHLATFANDPPSETSR